MHQPTLSQFLLLIPYALLASLFAASVAQFFKYKRLEEDYHELAAAAIAVQRRQELDQRDEAISKRIHEPIQRDEAISKRVQDHLTPLDAALRHNAPVHLTVRTETSSGGITYNQTETSSGGRTYNQTIVTDLGLLERGVGGKRA